MQFDPYNWTEVSYEATRETQKGVLHVMCSRPSNLWIEAGGVEVLAGFGQEIKIRLSEKVRFWLEPLTPDPDARAFLYDPMDTNHKPTGEAFTNVDRRPMESGAVLEVTKALRQMRLEAMETRTALRREREALTRERAQKPAPAPVADEQKEAPTSDEAAE